jgi:hypothetical protein
MSVYEARKQRKDRDNATGSFTGPLRGIVRTVIPELEALKVQTVGQPGALAMQVMHPYFGASSWIRAMPEVGTAVMTQQRGDMAQAEIVSYTTHNLASRVGKGATGNAVYRRLNTGEIEIMSSGRAYTHWGNDGNIMLLGGVTSLKLSQTDLEINSVATTHARRDHLHMPALLAHEERFGYVKRPDKLKPNALQTYIKLPDDTYAVEYSRFVTNKAGVTLATTQEGNVIDVNGAIVKNSATGRDLRFLKELTDASNNTLRLEIDDALNISLVNSATGIVDFNLSAGTQGNANVSGKTFAVDATQQATLAAGTTLTMKANVKAVVAAPLVEIGSGTMMPIPLAMPLTAGVLQPMLSALISLCGVLATVPALVTAVPTLTATTTALTAAAGSLSSVASTTVKVSI